MLSLLEKQANSKQDYLAAEAKTYTALFNFHINSISYSS